MKEATPLKWPESGWPRTRPQDQAGRSQWKKTQIFYVDQLELELKRMGALASVLTWNGPRDRDPGVAVWFSRKRKDDFTWQDTLEIKNPYPTLDEIETAYKKLVPRYHTDRPGEGDPVMFVKINEARMLARRWVSRVEGNVHDLAIACDAFRESRLNVAALWQTIKHIRGIERCGTSALMERAIEGFAQLTEGNRAAASA